MGVETSLVVRCKADLPTNGSESGLGTASSDTINSSAKARYERDIINQSTGSKPLMKHAVMRVDHAHSAGPLPQRGDLR